MKCPICDFISSDLETHSKFHVEGMDFLADNETLPPPPKKKMIADERYPLLLCCVCGIMGKTICRFKDHTYCENCRDDL